MPIPVERAFIQIASSFDSDAAADNDINSAWSCTLMVDQIFQ